MIVSHVSHLLRDFQTGIEFNFKNWSYELRNEIGCEFSKNKFPIVIIKRGDFASFLRESVINLTSAAIQNRVVLFMFGYISLHPRPGQCYAISRL